MSKPECCISRKIKVYPARTIIGGLQAVDEFGEAHTISANAHNPVFDEWFRENFEIVSMESQSHPAFDAYDRMIENSWNL